MGGCKSKQYATIAVESSQTSQEPASAKDDGISSEFDDVGVSLDSKARKLVLKHWNGVRKGTEMLVKDQFTSKYSKEKMNKWRRATVRALFQPSGIRINFTGWKDKHDIQLNLDHDEDMCRCAPISLIPEYQRKSGAALSRSQLELARYSPFLILTRSLASRCDVL